MKKIVAMFLCLVLLLSGAALAEESVDYEALIAEKDARIAELEAKVAELEEQVRAYEEKEAEVYPTLQKGSNGNDVVTLQSRLKVLGYLEGSADGAYGNGTASAVSAFQAAAGLEETGIADSKTQEALFADDAPKAQVYVSLDYTAVARDPDTYEGSLVKFSGKIVQVMENDDVAVFRIATKNGYDDVVYCTYTKPENYKRFLEDDKVNIWGTCTGVYTYETVMGNDITIPACQIDRIELK